MILLDKYVKFLVKFEITEKQLLGLILAYYEREDLKKLYKETFGKDLLTDQDKGILKRKGLLREDNLGRTLLSQQFKDIFVDKDVATDEIFRRFPLLMIEENGVEQPTADIDRSIFANLYTIAILGSVEEHEEVLEDIDYAKEHNLLNIGLSKFLKSQYWVSIREQRLKAIV